jgi:hypothetical protein
MTTILISLEQGFFIWDPRFMHVLLDIFEPHTKQSYSNFRSGPTRALSFTSNCLILKLNFLNPINWFLLI